VDKVNRASRIRAVHAVPVELELWGIPCSMRADKCCSALARILPLLPILGRENTSVSWKYCLSSIFMEILFIIYFHGNTVKRESFRFMEITFHGNICANTGGTNVQSRTVLAI